MDKQFYEVIISTHFGLHREFKVYFESQREANAWLDGHNFTYDEGWAGENYMEIELQFSDPGYRTFFGNL